MRAVASVVAAACLAVTSAAAAAPWSRVTDRAGGYSIAVPASWQVVPRSTRRLDARVAQARALKQFALANQLAEIAAVRRKTRTVYRFQAFAWPPPKGAVVPDVTVRIAALTRRTTRAALAPIARQIAKSLSRAATVSASRRLVLPAGEAFEVAGSIPLSKSLRSPFAIYLLMHDRRLYSLTFRGPAAAAERGILDSFRFT